MGKRGLPPLSRGEVIAILLAAEFKFSSRKKRHDNYEHPRIRGQRRCASVSHSYNEICGDVLQSIIKQSGMTKTEFYGMTATTAKKLQCPFLNNGLPAHVRS
jgi:predicted RNA binding protein YcfA (HicA-like mRNA interferase family)